MDRDTDVDVVTEHAPVNVPGCFYLQIIYASFYAILSAALCVNKSKKCDLTFYYYSCRENVFSYGFVTMPVVKKHILYSRVLVAGKQAVLKFWFLSIKNCDNTVAIPC